MVNRQAKDARSALTRRPARSYSAPTIPATVRHARRRSGERHERSIPRPPALPAPLADPPIAPQPTHTRLRRASDVSLHVRRARTHRRPARTPSDITSAPPATPLGARPASVTHRCSDARSATRRNSPTSTSRRAAGSPEPASSRRSRANGCLPGELRTAPSRQPQEFRKRLYR